MRQRLFIIFPAFAAFASIPEDNAHKTVNYDKEETGYLYE